MSEEKFLTVKLDEKGERYIFPDSTKSKFGSDTDYLVQISERDFDLAFDFAYAMTFAGKGEHNSTSFTRDSKHKRSVGEIFVNTLQGKLSELATYNYCINNGHVCNEVDFSIGKLNYWDNIDLRINEKNTSIKSTKGYSMFLFLEVGNYDKHGNYKYPYDGKATITSYLLCRVQSKSGEFIEGILKSNRWLYSKQVNKEELYKALKCRTWLVELSGFVSKTNLVKYVINESHIMEQGKIMGKSDEVMKVDNYYVHVSDLRFKYKKK